MCEKYRLNLLKSTSIDRPELCVDCCFYNDDLKGYRFCNAGADLRKIYFGEKWRNITIECSEDALRFKETNCFFIEIEK